jgi:hypothetical protein
LQRRCKPFALKADDRPADDLGMLRLLLGFRRTHRSVPLRSLRRHAAAKR